MSSADEIATRTVVIGASAAGLATSACLARAGEAHVLLEQAAQVATSWRGHYDRLHLHTHKGGSALPYLPFPAAMPRYPSRDQVVEYLESYVTQMKLAPRLGEGVRDVHADGQDWIVESARARYRCRNVVVATGFARRPFQPSWPDRALFGGELLHSSAYKNGEAYRGRRVLVVGFGNSAGEIALDLVEHGASATLAVRGAVNVIPRELLGLPILAVSALMSPLPTRLADALGAPLARLHVGDIETLGLRKLPYGPLTQVIEHGHIPLIDVGTIAAIRKGQIAVRRGVERFTTDGVRFEDGTVEPFDAVVAATGYRPGLADFLADADSLCTESGMPRASGVALRPGLYFCGFYVSPRGMLHEIAKESRRIARAIATGP